MHPIWGVPLLAFCVAMCIPHISACLWSPPTHYWETVVSQQLHPLVSLSDQRVACMLLFTAWPFSASLWDVSSFPCTSSKWMVMLLRAFFAMSSFHLALLFVLSMLVISLTALSAWICSLATIIGSLTVVLLKLLWLGLEYLELCRSSDAPQCEHCPCNTLPNSDSLPFSNSMVFGLVPLLSGIVSWLAYFGWCSPSLFSLLTLAPFTHTTHQAISSFTSICWCSPYWS